MRPTFLAATLLTGCVAQPAADLSWRFEATPVPGEIKVLPIIGPSAEPEVILESWVGAGVTQARARLREARAEQLGALPESIRTALPGEVHAALRGTWTGEFRVARYPIGGRERLSGALRTRQGLDDSLGVIARAADSAILVTWVESLDGIPLTVHGPPGELVETAAGPVLVDLYDEPYQVEATIGCALVAADGEVVVRYTDTFETVLSGSRDTAAAGRELAAGLAHEVAKVWPADPRLQLALAEL